MITIVLPANVEIPHGNGPDMSLETKDNLLDYPVCASAPLLQRAAFRDIDHQAAQLIGHDQHYQQISTGAFRGAFTTAMLGPNDWLFVEDTNQALLQHGATPRDQCSFMFLLTDDGWCRFQGRDFTSRDLAIFPASSDYSVRCPPDTSFCVITIERAALRDVFELDAPRFGTARCLMSPQMALIVAALRSLVGSSFSILHESADTAFHRSTLTNLRRALVSTISLALSTDLGPPAASDRRLYKRACDLVNAGLGDIDVVGLCRSLDVPRRTLEATFRQELGIGPARYIKALRLNKIRREIVADDAADRSLADIAASWGLWHPSHFTESYSAMFGELPSQTRQRK